MSVFALNLQARIQNALADAVRQASWQGWALEAIPLVELEVPREKAHGDLATNGYATSLDAKLPPRRIAEEIIGHLNMEGHSLRLQVAGPGFINLRLSNEWLYEVMRDIARQGTDWDAHGLAKVSGSCLSLSRQSRWPHECGQC